MNNAFSTKVSILFLLY